MKMNKNIMSEDKSPLDELVDQVQSYIDDPKLVTPETLEDLKTQLVDLKTVFDSDEESEEESEDSHNMETNDRPTIVIALEKKRGYK